MCDVVIRASIFHYVSYTPAHAPAPSLRHVNKKNGRRWYCSFDVAAICKS